MSKPQWKDAPDWAMYLARDEDGTWGWYEEKPLPDNLLGAWEAESKRWLDVPVIPEPEWDCTLEKRPNVVGAKE